MEAEDDIASPDPQKSFILPSRIPSLTDIRFIETLPQEERENRFRVVLDNISDGVVSIGKKGRVTPISKMAL